MIFPSPQSGAQRVVSPVAVTANHPHPRHRTVGHRASDHRQSDDHDTTFKLDGVWLAIRTIKNRAPDSNMKTPSPQMEHAHSSIFAILSLWPIPYPFSCATAAVFFLELIPLPFGFERTWDIFQNDKLFIGNMVRHDEKARETTGL